MINEEKRENGEATNEEGVGNFFFCVVVKKSPSSFPFFPKCQ